jgi:alpha-D-ribose 1-methylphosphonate 5-triphosphate diphosphatase
MAEHGLVDILSSDYVPSSLLHAAFLMATCAGDAADPARLPAAVATVSATPAAAIGFTDRGAIAQGLAADLVRVVETPALPVVRAVWRRGERIA